MFNRASTTRRVFDAIRAARPPRLYVAADGPRADRPGEAERCAEVRAIATAVDWPCEVRTLWRDRNLGCEQAVSQGITWFFEHEPEGIVLEDDVLPLPDFFRFCDELLARHRDDPRVMSISGCNLVGDRVAFDDSYAFSIFTHVWGWASWRRAWQHYDARMPDLPAWLASGALRALHDGQRCAADYWHDKLCSTRAGREGTWDYQWLYACWRQGGLSALPRRSMVTNLGLGADATHPVDRVADYVRNNPAEPMAWPLRHPAEVRRHAGAEAANRRHVTGLGPLRCLKRRLRRVLLGPPEPGLAS